MKHRTESLGMFLRSQVTGGGAKATFVGAAPALRFAKVLWEWKGFLWVFVVEKCTLWLFNIAIGKSPFQWENPL